MNLKKLLSTIVAIVTLVPLQAASFYVEAAFSDVTPFYPYTEAISYLQERGKISGYSDGSFRPNDLISRAEFLKIVVGGYEPFAQKLTVCDQSLYTFHDLDLDTQEKFGAYICVAKLEGVISGYSDGTFQPYNSITFGEASKITWNTYGEKENIPLLTGSGYDIPTFDENFWLYITNLNYYKAIPESIEGVDVHITRGEMAEIVYRYLTYNELGYLRNPISFTDKQTLLIDQIPVDKFKFKFIPDKTKSSGFDAEIVIDGVNYEYEEDEFISWMYYESGGVGGALSPSGYVDFFTALGTYYVPDGNGITGYVTWNVVFDIEQKKVYGIFQENGF
ncbi:S-layer homology domain-containing protein [Candidatus Dojkabacteria bacterium]|uniref:S-layer homology domain-containing protein n=1 Tax=Candidatus Dojkabacteria bacterium TaxID=2099670 RepID=A0A955RKM0_9BACT|nr:S-layer homology domain-containing protein [Candidatus Dojkabacteria bacterium]